MIKENKISFSLFLVGEVIDYYYCEQEKCKLNASVSGIHNLRSVQWHH
jgi:hypothetical protein